MKEKSDLFLRIFRTNASQSTLFLLRHHAPLEKLHAMLLPLGPRCCSAIECPRPPPQPLIAIATKRGGRRNRTVVVVASSSSRPQRRLHFRRGLPEDSGLFFKLILGEKMNPFIKPERFLVAEEEERKTEKEGAEKKENKKVIVAFGQLAELEPGKLFELRSLVTIPERRGRGIGAKVVRGLLEEAATAASSAKREEEEEGSAATKSSAEVVLTTISRRRAFYEREGFEQVPSDRIPKQLRLEVAIGSVVARLAVGDSLIVLRKKV